MATATVEKMVEEKKENRKRGEDDQHSKEKMQMKNKKKEDRVIYWRKIKISNYNNDNAKNMSELQFDS